ncbi:bifunctional folylpolyglutamate synthase/dihydrofolate synthase [Liquorilactobacillus capillatus]|uniref:tetrahydrofolate synthase n=1 Tax=Liquorilactobacillus capillatus DSM 19910 TaxID=1423731 RepID=A0A0R1MB08_9LACO|nr:Mur ligase family protein [Liquorilactobacillus capillatus]KRL01203.1 bifunctional folylpolyglutamate synthase dihydrofolate synthase [Liquorilactobacillus capillatus DSM 19910]
MITNNSEERLPTTLYGQGDRIALIKKVLQQLQQPDENFKIIHVCGTNGKGSTCTMIAALLQNMNYKTGLFSSPFITNITECIQINRQPIAQSMLKSYTDKVKQTLVEMGLELTALSSFELLFSAAMLYFSDKKVNYVVLECGLGGELDATNAVSQTTYAVFTKIGLDHTAVLGKTIAEIATTKSKIIREKETVILAPKQREKTLAVLKKQAYKMHAHIHSAAWTKITFTEEKTLIRKACWQTTTQKILFDYSLRGSYQKENLATVLTWLDIFLKRQHRKINRQRLLEGALSNIVIPGRFESVSTQPSIILDAAHNIDGINAFVETVNQLYPTSEKILLVGFLRDKDYKHCIEELLKLKKTQFIITEPDNQERKLTAKELQISFQDATGKQLPQFADPVAALEYALKIKPEKDALILVVGSFYLLKVIRQLFTNEKRKE